MKIWVSWKGIPSLSESHLKTPFPSYFNHLLQLCSTSRALRQGKQVHQQIIMYGFSSNPYLQTKLVQMYADCDDLDPARQLFDELPQPNIFAWTAILSFCSRHGKYSECLSIYLDMKSHGIKPDGYIFPKVLKACAQLPALDKGVRVHNDIIQVGAESNLHVCNSLIDMYAKCGDIKKAHLVFKRMSKRDLFSWNSMISGYVCNGFLDSALELLNLLKSEGFQPDLVTWNTIMDGYRRIGLCEEASKIFDRIAEPNIISWTTLILSHSRSGKHEKALCIFREMISAWVDAFDLDTLSCVLSSCRHLAFLRNGQEIHGYGIKMWSGAGLYGSMGAALVTMYAGCKRIQDATHVFEMMDKGDVVTWNAMILGFTHLGMGELALDYFSIMHLRGVKYDENTISSVLPACDLKSGKQIHAHIIRTCFGLPVFISNALINMYSKSGCLESAYSVFSKMGARDAISWNTMIGGYGMHGHGRAALQLLQEMKQSGFQPNSVTFTSLLSACSHSGLVDEGLELFNSLSREFGSTMEQFACIVDLLGRAGRLSEAVDFINKMPIVPDGSVWGALLAACQVNQNMDFGKLAAEHLFCIEPENPGNYVTLANMYARAGRWDDAKRVRKLMETRGLVKPTGYSRIGAEDGPDCNLVGGLKLQR